MCKLKLKWEIGDGGRNGLRRALKEGNEMKKSGSRVSRDPNSHRGVALWWGIEY
jgi:hypothetical protein